MVQHADIDHTGLTGVGASDPIADFFGTPDTAFEFDSSSLTGLTAIGSPSVEDADTTVPGHLYYKDATSGLAMMGRYLASPSTPFTVITKITDFNANASSNAAGLAIGVSDPSTGAFVSNTVGDANRVTAAVKFTNRTTFSSVLGSTAIVYPSFPLYLACVVNSTSSIDYLISHGGIIWRKYLAASDPGLTVGSVAIVFKSQNAGGAAAAFDYLRIWNSAKTFVGS